MQDRPHLSTELNKVKVMQFAIILERAQFSSVYILSSTTYNLKYLLTIHTKRISKQRYRTCYRKINTLNRKLIQYTVQILTEEKMNCMQGASSIGKLIEEGATWYHFEEHFDIMIIFKIINSALSLVKQCTRWGFWNFDKHKKLHKS